MCVIFLRRTPKEDLPGKIATANVHDPEVTETRIPDATQTPWPTVPRSASGSAVPENRHPPNFAADVPLNDFTFGTTTLPKPAASYTSGSPAFAVLDLKRLVAEILPAEASPDELAQTIQDIQRATATRAAAHDFSVVFDISGNSINNVPVVLSAGGAFNLTEEVRHELGR